MLSLNRNSIAILDINGIDYVCIISGISKVEAINLIKKCWFEWKNGSLQNIKISLYRIKDR